MTARILYTAGRNLAIKNSIFRSPLQRNNFDSFHLLKCETTTIDSIRSISFLNKTTGADLWKSCSSVSNAGKKRGRAKTAGKGKTKNLNIGQVIGEGRQRLKLPGLNESIKNGDKLNKQAVDTPDPTWSDKLHSLRNANLGRNRFKITHLERGYSGHKLAGRSVGAPEGHCFAEFDTRVIETKIVNVMKSNIGRKRTHSTFAITGNGNGVAGFGLGRSAEPKSAVRLAKKHASLKLMHFELCGRTVYHDFFTQFGPTKIFVYKMPEGYGLRCHRVIGTFCKLIGIQDLRAKVEGSTNPTQIVKAFAVGLLQQKTYQQMAEEKKLFLIEFSPNRLNFPTVVGRPFDLNQVRKADEIPKDEIMDFKQYCFNGRIPLKRPPRQKPFEKLPSYQRYLKKKEKRRAWPATRLYLRTRYGRLASFLTEKYPEAVGFENNEY